MSLHSFIKYYIGITHKCRVKHQAANVLGPLPLETMDDSDISGDIELTTVAMCAPKKPNKVTNAAPEHIWIETYESKLLILYVLRSEQDRCTYWYIIRHAVKGFVRH